MKPGEKVNLVWLKGGAPSKGEVVSTVMNVKIDGEEYQYEMGHDGLWYEINHSQDPVSIEEIVQNAIIGECVLCGKGLIRDGEYVKCVGCGDRVKSL